MTVTCLNRSGRRINLHDNLKWIDSHKDKYWMGFNETCAYLHTEISESYEKGFSLELNYDNHYCQYFEKKSSIWTVEFSDDFRKKIQSQTIVYVDGLRTNIQAGSIQRVTIPPGSGKHKIELAGK